MPRLTGLTARRRTVGGLTPAPWPAHGTTAPGYQLVRSVDRAPIEGAETGVTEPPRACVKAVELRARRALEPLDTCDHGPITSWEVFDI